MAAEGHFLPGKTHQAAVHSDDDCIVFYDCIGHQYGYSGAFLYNRFVNKMEDMTTQSAEQAAEPDGNQSGESYLRNMRRISDAMYYSVIKDKDLATDSLDEEMNLLYEANKDNLVSIACYTYDGRLVALQRRLPRRKNNLDIVVQEWFTEATDRWRTCIFPHRMYRICLTIRVTAITGRILSQAVELTKRRQFDTWCAACGI